MIKEFQGEHRFLSNFWPVTVVLDGIEYKTVEHAYQAAKTENFNLRMTIQEVNQPGVAKRIGNKLPLRRDWEEIKLAVMESLVRQKFQQEPLRQKLLATGDEELQEGNWWGDRYWGVDLRTGKGENHLGKILMKVRAELRQIENESFYKFWKKEDKGRFL